MKKFLKIFFWLFFVAVATDSIYHFIMSKKRVKHIAVYHYPFWDPSWECSEAEFFHKH